MDGNELSFAEQGGRHGVKVIVTDQGLWISGWFDSFVEIDGGLIPWSAVEKIRSPT